MKKSITKYLLGALLMCSYTFKVQAQKHQLNINEHSTHAIAWDDKFVFIGEDGVYAYYSASGIKNFDLVKVNSEGDVVSQNTVTLNGFENLEDAKTSNFIFLNNKPVLIFTGFVKEEKKKKKYACPVEDDGTLDAEKAALLDEWEASSSYTSTYGASLTTSTQIFFNFDTTEFIYCEGKFGKGDDKLPAYNVTASCFDKDLKKINSAKFQLQVTGMNIYEEFGAFVYQDQKLIISLHAIPQKIIQANGGLVLWTRKDVNDYIFSCNMQTGKVQMKTFPIERMRDVESYVRTKDKIFILGYMAIDKTVMGDFSYQVTKRFVTIYDIATGVLLTKTLPLQPTIYSKLNINYGNKPLDLGKYSMRIASHEVQADGSVIYSIIHTGLHDNSIANEWVFEVLKISPLGVQTWSVNYPLPDYLNVSVSSIVKNGFTYIFFSAPDKKYTPDSKDGSTKDLVMLVYNDDGKKQSESIIYNWEWSDFVLNFDSFAWISNKSFLFEVKKKDTAFFATMSLD